MKYIIVKEKCKIRETGKEFNPGEVHIVYSNDMKDNRFFEIQNEILIRYLHKYDSKINNIFISYDSGIGDIIAHSALCEFLSDKKIHFATSLKLYGVFDWFTKEVNLIDIEGPIITDYSFQSKLTKYAKWRRIQTEYTIINNNDFDWYEILFRQLGLETILPSYLRPSLKTKRITNKESNIKHDNALLVCNKATCMMRSMEFKEIYNALSDEIKKKYTIYVHEDNLSAEDLKTTFEGVKVIKANSIGDYLLDLYDAKEVISVDSAAMHFREGVEKHCIGLYNSFPKEIRTAYYQYTDAFNIKSECPRQPCYKYLLTLTDICEEITEWQFSAPCVRSENNKTLQKQLRNIFNEYVI